MDTMFRSQLLIQWPKNLNLDSSKFATEEEGNCLRFFAFQSVCRDAMKRVFDNAPGTFQTKWNAFLQWYNLNKGKAKISEHIRFVFLETYILFYQFSFNLYWNWSNALRRHKTVFILHIDYTWDLSTHICRTGKCVSAISCSFKVLEEILEYGHIWIWQTLRLGPLFNDKRSWDKHMMMRSMLFWPTMLHITICIDSNSNCLNSYGTFWCFVALAFNYHDVRHI